MADEARILEDAEVLRHGRPAHRESGRELSHGPLPASKELEDLAARRVAECIQGMSVSNHLP
jgi:hypothetical protein